MNSSTSQTFTDGQYYDTFFGTLAYCANKWHSLLMYNKPVKASFALDIENLFFVLLAFASKSPSWNLPWDEGSIMSVAGIKFTFCSDKDFAFKYLSFYCRNESINLLHVLYSELWSGVVIAQEQQMGLHASLQSNNFFSIMVDGTTDSSVSDAEIIYIWYTSTLLAQITLLHYIYTHVGRL